MPEENSDKTIFTLLEVLQSIQETLSTRYTGSFWVKAEMNKLNLYSYSGHCYPELVEKKDNKVIAQVKSTLWRDDYNYINSKFIRVLNEPLKDGIKILFQARIAFDPVYGLSLRILDIDPSYTLGDLEREKQETIRKLQEEGIFEKNKELSFPLLPSRIAVISVETSKGYADFLNIIENNSWNYRFFHFLFPSLLQGEKAVDGIKEQLERIRKVLSHFDVVAIIRGGGGDIGLSCYNDYLLAREIALFPIPVITGIGHATNETVTEMVSFVNAITPTKLAEFLIQRFHNFNVPVNKAEEIIADRALKIIGEEKSRFQSEIRTFQYTTANILLRSHNNIRELSATLHHESQNIFRDKKEKLIHFSERLTFRIAAYFTGKSVALDNLEKNLINMSPQNVLKRGYSITFLNGRAVKSISEVHESDTLKTILHEGIIESIVKSTDQSKTS
ncbi:MAG: exodeoxyribonuclease VII large subunit [Bacteroidota bacterium]|nr:exodeoxyribonuclease VII large subunit [Bacteroidota bacterium]